VPSGEVVSFHFINIKKALACTQAGHGLKSSLQNEAIPHSMRIPKELPHTGYVEKFSGLRLVSVYDAGYGITNKKELDFSSPFLILGWLMGLEPTTTGITIQGSTN
jgi:hypothetical protein